MRAKGHSQNKFMRIITVPIRVLSKARDFYIRSMTNAAERVSYGNAMGCPAVHISRLPKSFTVTSSRFSQGDDVVGSLRRSVSANTSGDGRPVDMNVFMQGQPLRLGARAAAAAAPPSRSCRFPMGRIDEDRPCDFEEDI